MVSINSRQCGFLCAQVVMSERLSTPPDTHTSQEMRECPCFLRGFEMGWERPTYSVASPVSSFVSSCVTFCDLVFVASWILSVVSLFCVKNLVKFRVCSFSRAVYAASIPSASVTHRSFCLRLNFLTFSNFRLKNKLSAVGRSRECGLSL